MSDNHLRLGVNIDHVATIRNHVKQALGLGGPALTTGAFQQGITT